MTEQLHDEEAFKPENLFDTKKFNTIFVNREGFTAKQNETAGLIVQLLDPAINRAESEEIFKSLFKANAQALMVEAIQGTKGEDDRKTIAAACWESGLDFSGHYSFFADLVMNSGFGLAMEAFTVIQEMSAPPHEEMSRTLSQIGKTKEPANAIVLELRAFINSKLNLI